VYAPLTGKEGRDGRGSGGWGRRGEGDREQ
jgi:hypothetical protein